MNVYTINAFVEAPGSGNPAGVVLCDMPIDELQMQQIAAQVGFSETAFVLDSVEADYRVRFFTPVEEVDFCGHATLGTFALLFEKGRIGAGSYTQQTRAGILPVTVDTSGRVIMDQAKPVFDQQIQREDPLFARVAHSLGLEAHQLSPDFLEVVSTGLRDLIVGVESDEALAQIVPCFAEIAEISRELDITGYHVYTLHPHGNWTAACRNFAPLVGIDEEAATGSSSGALAAYLVHHRLVDVEGTCCEMQFVQGREMNRASRIDAQIHIKNGEIDAVRVGGAAGDLSRVEVTI